MKTKLFGVLLFVFLFIVFSLNVADATTGPATQAIQKPIGDIIAVLEDPIYKNGTRFIEQRDKIKAIAVPYYDFPAIAQATISRSNWNRFSDSEKIEFINVFTTFISNLYAEQLQANYGGEEVQFIAEQVKSSTKVYVKSIVVQKNGTKTPIDYSLWLKDGRWKIYNVFVEGTSLLGNYRNEFDRVLAKQTPADLIKILNDKVALQRTKGSAVRK